MKLPVIESTIAEDARRALARDVDGEVRFSKHIRLLYATDASPYQVEPLGVVQPKHAKDIQRTVRWCKAHGVPVLPRGGGTSLAGQTVNHAMVVDCSVHMTACSIDPDRRIATLQPGVVLDDLRAAAAVHGLTFGAEVSTSAQATLGGMVANNSAGLHSLWWGMTADHVESLDVVLADGQLARFEAGASGWDPEANRLAHALQALLSGDAQAIAAAFPDVVRNNGGYRLDLLLQQIDASTPGSLDQVDLARLICGSEGTLAFVTGMELRLVPQPSCTGLLVFGFDSVGDALEQLEPILSVGPSAVELLDDDVIDATQAHAVYSSMVELLPRVQGRLPGAVLYVDIFADSDAALADKMKQVRSAVPDRACVEAVDETSRRQLWEMRKIGLGLLSGGTSKRRPVPGVEDCAVPVSELRAFHAAFDALLNMHGVRATWYAHASVGLLHVRPRLDMRDAADRELFRVIGQEALELVRLHKGSISGEHGDGRIRSALVHAFYGPTVVEAFRAVKRLFDPEGRFNPGMVVEPGALLSDLRLDHETQVQGEPEETFFDWTAEGSLGAAAAQCNGQGLCRRTSAGAMCPSYRATRDERHSTRGRGNALRLAMTGQTTPGMVDFSDPETHKTLDLCLGCKACRYECPSQVDVTKQKAEYEAQHYVSGGKVPWRIRARASVRQVNRIGSLTWRLANALQRLGPVSWAAKRALGVHPRRTLPTWGPSLQRWARNRQRHSDTPVVLLYPDCFTTWNEPALGMEAIRLLEAFGYRVVMPKADCCGRTSCSAGLLWNAAAQISRSARSVRAAMHEHNAMAVVAVEPSCATAMQQEWTELRTSAPMEAKAVSQAAGTVESFLLEHWDVHPIRPDFKPTTYSVLVHVHCHQKHRASTVEALFRKCGFTSIESLDSGCCGMAGSFGYNRDTYDLSMRIAEQSLGHAIANRRGAIVAAHGTSCRQQLADAFDVKALHPVSLLLGAVQRSRC